MRCLVRHVEKTAEKSNTCQSMVIFARMNAGQKAKRAYVLCVDRNSSTKTERQERAKIRHAERSFCQGRAQEHRLNVSGAGSCIAQKRNIQKNITAAGIAEIQGYA